MQDDDKDTTNDNPSQDDKDKGRLPEDREKAKKAGRIYKESYQPNKDDLDTSKPPEGSGVPPKSSSDEKDE